MNQFLDKYPNFASLRLQIKMLKSNFEQTFLYCAKPVAELPFFKHDLWKQHMNLQSRPSSTEIDASIKEV